MRVWTLAACVVVVAACGAPAGKPADAVKPATPTAASALGEGGGAGGGECRDTAGKAGEPLIVDWKAEQRDDLEIAMKDSVAIVSYSCKGIKVLPDCKLEGKYGFLGTTRKEQVVQLANADELSVNLPLSGAKISGELQRGSTIDIAMVTVGKRRTTWDTPSTNDLKGGAKCEGATHFVRGASIGAFAVDTGTDGKVRAAAEMFGAGGKGSSTASQKIATKQGDLGDCQKATPDGATPPSQCGSPIRILLQPIAVVEKGKTDAPPPPPAAAQKPEEERPHADESQACQPPFVFANGKCTKPSEKVAHVCKPGDLKDCTAQCEKGNAQSCGEQGVAMVHFGPSGNVAKTKENEAAFAPLKKGCDGDSALACGTLGYLYSAGVGTKADPAAAAKAYEKACAGGDPLGCRELGRIHEFGTGVTKDVAKSATLYRQACDGGDKIGCSFLGGAYAEGTGVPKDNAKAIEYRQRACDGGFAPACSGVGAMFEAAHNPIAAELAYRRGCYRATDFASSCAGLGRVLTVKNDASAKMILDRACAFQSPLACAILKLAYNGTQVTIAPPNEVNAAMAACNKGDAMACTNHGLLMSLQNPKLGKISLDRACKMNDQFGCAMLKKIP